MSDVKINGINAGDGLPQIKKPLDAGSSHGFDAIMNEVIGKLSQVKNDAEKAVNGAASGGDITQTIVEMEKADMNFQLMIEVRNKLLSAYEEIMRMQV